MTSCSNQPSGPASDDVWSSTTVTKSITRCNLVANIQVDSNIVILDELPVESATYTLIPYCAKTIFTFREPLQHNRIIVFNMDNSKSSVGDEMIWMIRNTQPEAVHINQITHPTFYYFTCGSLHTNIIINPYDFHLAQYWIFDGESWINTSDRG